MKYIRTYKICDWHIACNQDWISNVKGKEADDMPWIILGQSFLFFSSLLRRFFSSSDGKDKFQSIQKLFDSCQKFLLFLKYMFGQKQRRRHFSSSSREFLRSEEVHFNLEGKHLNYSIRCKYWKEKGTTEQHRSQS